MLPFFLSTPAQGRAAFPPWAVLPAPFPTAALLWALSSPEGFYLRQLP